MSSPNEHEINDAYFQGLVGLAAIFYVLKDIISPINKEHFQNLIIIFVVVSLIRVFGVILNFEKWKLFSGDMFAVILFPYTFYVGARILLTKIYPSWLTLYIIPSYIQFVLMLIMAQIHYGYELKWRNPIYLIKKK